MWHRCKTLRAITVVTFVGSIMGCNPTSTGGIPPKPEGNTDSRAGIQKSEESERLAKREQSLAEKTSAMAVAEQFLVAMRNGDHTAVYATLSTAYQSQVPANYQQNKYYITWLTRGSSRSHWYKLKEKQNETWVPGITNYQVEGSMGINSPVRDTPFVLLLGKDRTSGIWKIESFSVQR